MVQGNIMSKNKVLVLGSTGMLGHQVVNYLEKFDDLIVDDISYRNKLRKNTMIVDAMDKQALEEAIVQLKPNFIINCIGVLIKGSVDTGASIYLNAYLPHQLKGISKTINAKLINISTDCVFSGKDGQYIEADLRDGKGTYAQTKILGEVIDEDNLTLRTSIIGPELKRDGEGLFHWFMNQTGAISGYTKAIWSGVTTLELAKFIKWSIDNNITGIYHVTNNSSIDKFSLLKLFKKYTKKNVHIEPYDKVNIDKSFVDTRLLRDYEIPSYDQMISDLVDYIFKNKSLYSHYKVGKFERE